MIVLYNVISQYPRVREIIFLNRKRIITHLLGAGAGSSMRGIRACSLESRFWMSEPARISWDSYPSIADLGSALEKFESHGTGYH